MEDFTRLLTIALAVVSIATLAGLGLLRGVVTGLRESLKDAREEIADKDRRLTAAEAQMTAAQAQVGSLRNDLGALGRVVTGEAHWVAIGDKLDLHHTRAEEHWTRDEATLVQIRDLLNKREGS